MRDSVEGTGYTCTGWEVVDRPADAIARAECTPFVTFSIHADKVQVLISVQAAALGASYLGNPTAHVVGPDWSVDCVGGYGFPEYEDVCGSIAIALDGELVVSSPQG